MENQNVSKSSFYDSIVKNLKQEAEKLNRKLTVIRENNQDMNMYISTLKSLRETLELISRYDWKLNYSEYKTEEFGKEIKQVSIWEQNFEGNIRNHKVWEIFDIKKEEIYETTKEIIDGIICDITMRSGFGEVYEGIDEETEKQIKKEWEKIIMKELKYGFNIET